MDQVREEPPTNLITRTDEDPETDSTMPEIELHTFRKTTCHEG